MMHSRNKIWVLLHILVLFKNDASLRLGKKNEQSLKFSPKNSQKTLQLPGKQPTEKKRTCQATKAMGH